MKFSFRVRIFVFVALPLLVILGGAEIYQLRQLAQVERARVVADHLELVTGYAAELDARLREIAQLVNATAVAFETHAQPGVRAHYEQIRRILELDPLIYGAGIWYGPGEFQGRARHMAYIFRAPAGLRELDAGSYLDYTSANCATCQFWSRPLELGRAVWTDPYVDVDAGNVFMVTYSAPFRAAGRIRGIAQADVQLPTLGNQVFGQAAARHRLFVLDSGLRLVFAEEARDIGHSLQEVAQRASRPDWIDIGRAVLASRAGWVAAPGLEGQEAQLFFHAPVKSTGWGVGIRLDESEVFAPVRRQIEQDLLALGAALLALLAGIGAVTGRVTRPVARLDAAARQVAAGDMNLDLPTTGSDELGRLSRTFADMARTLVERERALVAEVAARERLESELAVARTLQLAMLPHPDSADPPRGRFEVAAILAPAKAVGGDLYDYFMLDAERLCFVIGDVSDKGVPAALFMVRVRTLLHSLPAGIVTPDALLAGLNRVLCQENDSCMFVTMACGVLDLATGVVALASAGHDQPLLARRAGTDIESIQIEGGIVLGVDEGATYSSVRIELKPGDALLLYTDGVTEAFNRSGHAFDRTGLEATLRRTSGSARSRADAIVAAVRRFAGDAEQSDDIAVLIMRFSPTSILPAA